MIPRIVVPHYQDQLPNQTTKIPAIQDGFLFGFNGAEYLATRKQLSMAVTVGTCP
jgi:hypothetical protein